MRRVSAVVLVLWASASVAGAETPYEVIKGFNNLVLPYAGVIQGSDGALYGTSSQGVDYGLGTVFRVPPTGLPFRYFIVSMAQPERSAIHSRGAHGGSGGCGTAREPQARSEARFIRA